MYLGMSKVALEGPEVAASTAEIAMTTKTQSLLFHEIFREVIDDQNSVDHR